MKCKTCKKEVEGNWIAEESERAYRKGFSEGIRTLQKDEDQGNTCMAYFDKGVEVGYKMATKKLSDKQMK